MGFLSTVGLFFKGVFGWVASLLKAIPAKAWPWLIAGAGVLLLLLFLRAHWIGVGVARERPNTEKVQALYDAHLAADQEAMKVYRAENQRIHDASQAAIAEAEARYQKEKDDAVAKERRIAADLRSGNLQLRQLWKNCATAGAAGADASPEGGGGEAELRAASEGDLFAAVAAAIRVGDDADAQVTLLQGVIGSRPDCFVLDE